MKEYFGKVQGGAYVCKACGKSERSHSNLRCHVESQHYSPGYSCENCGKGFKMYQTYTRHTKKC